jgi:hypothetical protein
MDKDEARNQLDCDAFEVRIVVDSLSSFLLVADYKP